MVALGRVEVICGPMFAGKTEELLRRVRRAVIAGRGVVVVARVGGGCGAASDERVAGVGAAAT